MTKGEKAFFLTVMILLGIVTALAIYTVVSEVKDNQSQSGDVNIRFYVDPETKVEYVIYESGYKGNICPRYNQDGTLYIRDVREVEE